MPASRSVIALLLVIYFTECLGLEARSLTMAPKTFAQAYRDADAVTVVKIDGAAPRSIGSARCGTEFSGLVQRVLKGEQSGKTKPALRFGRTGNLKKGGVYLLFLRSGKDVKSEFEIVKKRYPNLPDSKLTPDMRRVIRCGGLIPGLIVDPDFAWPVEKNEVVVFGLWNRHSIPASIRIDEVRPLQMKLRATDVFNYLSKLGGK